MTATLSSSALSTPQNAPLLWDQLPSLPPSPGETRQVGVAGPYTGVHHNALLVAGGANFPDKLPWDGGVKAWWDDILVLERKPSGEFAWVVDERFKLPRAMGYGMSFSTRDGVVCVGGADNDLCYSDVFRLAWDPDKRAISTTVLPKLPEPLSFMSGAMIGNTLYVVGGQHSIKNPTFDAVFWALDLALEGRPDFGWRKLQPWPGARRVLPVAIAQSNGVNECLYLFSGRIPGNNAPTTVLTDAYRYDPSKNTWTDLGKVGGGAGVSIMAGTAITRGDDEVVLVGGSRGARYLQLERHDLRIAALRHQLKSASGDQARALERDIDTELQSKIKIYRNHTGFSREVLSYNTRTGAWKSLPDLPYESPVTTLAVRWGEAWVIPSGEVKPGIRSPQVLRATPAK